MNYIGKTVIALYGWTVYYFNDRDKAIAELERIEAPKGLIEDWQDGNASGLCMSRLEAKETYIGVFRDECDQTWMRDTVAHECVHAAFDILDHVGVKVDPNNHEALAYMIGHLAGECHLALRKNTKRKK